MNFILKTMDFILKMMDFVLKLMDLILKMLDFVLKLMDLIGEHLSECVVFRECHWIRSVPTTLNARWLRYLLCKIMGFPLK